MIYEYKKNFSRSKPEKTSEQMFLTVLQVKQLLDTIEHENNEFKNRDHCAIFLGFYLGLRIGEVVLLNRESFRHINSEIAYIKTLKTRDNLPERIPPVVEQNVSIYVRAYLDSAMRDSQKWFFESRPNFHMASSNMRKIFNSYLLKSGLDPMYSWHSLRHGRGVLVWDQFNDLQMVKEMLRQSTLSSAEKYIRMSPKSKALLRGKLDSEALHIDFPRETAANLPE